MFWISLAGLDVVRGRAGVYGGGRYRGSSEKSAERMTGYEFNQTGRVADCFFISGLLAGRTIN